MIASSESQPEDGWKRWSLGLGPKRCGRQALDGRSRFGRVSRVEWCRNVSLRASHRFGASWLWDPRDLEVLGTVTRRNQCDYARYNTLAPAQRGSN